MGFTVVCVHLIWVDGIDFTMVCVFGFEFLVGFRFGLLAAIGLLWWF